jgi:hypothetical protein
MQTQMAGKQTSQGGQDRSIRPAGSGTADVTAKHGDFVAQDENLDVLGRSGAGEQPQPAEHCDRDQVQQSEQHGPRSCHEHLESTKPQVTTPVLGFGTLQGSARRFATRLCASQLGVSPVSPNNPGVLPENAPPVLVNVVMFGWS